MNSSFFEKKFFSRLEYTVNKEKNVLGRGGGGSRTIKFIRGQGDDAQLKPSGKNLIVTIGPGLPKDSSKIYLFKLFF